jgi:UDP-N-acetylmuramate dehydrogenase
MIQIDTNIPLKELTSFKVGGPADYFVVVKTVDDVVRVLDYARERSIEVLVLGGGSNIVMSDSGFRGLVMYMQISGFQIVEENSDQVLVQISSGENWDKVVDTAVQNGWWGIENLSHIPGSMGAFAVQNVGAYGQDASQVVEYVEAIEVATGQLRRFSKDECNFRYRASIFNKEHKAKYVIVNTVLKLSKVPKPNLSYADLAKRFESTTATLPNIRKAIVEIRNKKFPFPTDATNGSAGSFFKNTILTEEQFKLTYQKIKGSISEEVAEKFLANKRSADVSGMVKVSSAFLVDICGLKGEKHGGVIVNIEQPLVIRNTGTATAKDILGLMKKIRSEVYKKTGVFLENEPELIGFTPNELADALEFS